MTILEKFLVCVGLLLCILLFWTIGGLSHSAALEKKCLENGYSGSRVTYDYTGFCLKTSEYGEIIIIKEKDLK